MIMNHMVLAYSIHQAYVFQNVVISATSKISKIYLLGERDLMAWAVCKPLQSIAESWIKDKFDKYKKNPKHKILKKDDKKTEHKRIKEILIKFDMCHLIS